jgi:DNA-binding CsgD family transcriptional regulator
VSRAPLEEPLSAAPPPAPGQAPGDARVNGNTLPSETQLPALLRARLEALATEALRVPKLLRGGSRDAAGRDVLLDVEVGGYRYVLARWPLQASRPHAVLSARELEIARMIAAGHTNKTVARVLDISSWTVSTHLRRIFAKLDVGSRAAMVARLLEDDMLGERLDESEGPLARGR